MSLDTIRTTRLAHFIHQAWRWIIEPTRAADPETRIRSRWYASIIVTLMPFGLLIAMVPALVDHRLPWEDAQVRGAVGLAVFLAICFCLNRSGHYKLAVIIAIGGATVGVYYLAILDTDAANHVRNEAYFVLLIIISSISLSRLLTTVFLVIQIIALVLLPLLNPAVTIEAIVNGPASLLVMTYVLVLSGTVLRDTLEKHQMAVLEQENAQRRRAEDQLRVSLAEKEVLLKEIHHRVKNNLQIVASLLSLQSNSVGSPYLSAQFCDSQNRIRSMALIHERLYRSDSLAAIDFAAYLRDLTGYLLQSYQEQIDKITLVVDASEVQLDIDTAIPCGLLVNELVSNALKHAFPSGLGGHVGVTMRYNHEGEYRLEVWDDGVGLPADLDLLTTTTLGLQLVRSLARQLDGTLEIISHPRTQFVVCFPDAGAPMRE